MELQFFHIIGIIAIFQSLFLSLFFFTHQKGSIVSNKILGSLLLAFAVYITYSFTYSIGMYQQFASYRQEIFIMGQAAFLIGPLLYLYIKSTIRTNIKFDKKLFLHAIPFILGLFLSGINYYYEDYNVWLAFFYLVHNLLLLIQQLFYMVLIVLLFKSSNINLKQFFGTSNNSKINWLKVFIISYIIIWNIKFQSFILWNVGVEFNFCPYTESMYFLTMFAFFNVIFFIGLKKPELFSTSKKLVINELDTTIKDQYRRKLLSSMEAEKFYLDPTLTLTSLSQRLAIPHTYVSKIVNESFNKNFCDFVNEYRIRESEQLILGSNNGKKVTMLEIAYSVGFNSKSSFYDAFKKHTGMAPREFKRFHSEQLDILVN